MNLLLAYHQCVAEKQLYTVPKVIDFPRYNMKCSGENVVLRGMFHEGTGFPLHFTLYCGNLDYFSNSTGIALQYQPALHAQILVVAKLQSLVFGAILKYKSSNSLMLL